jgi:DNA-binding FadR family transcriptional regulator
MSQLAKELVTAELLDDRGSEHAAYTQLQAYLIREGFVASQRLPPERELCELLGVSRGELRKALAIAELEGQIWRHVGKGTFIGPRPETGIDLAGVAHRSNPAEVMRARILLEPAICREAALKATSADIAELEHCVVRSRTADSWRRYESWDNRFHRGLAEAAHNTILVALFDNLNAIRRAVVWGRLRSDPEGPSPSHHSFGEHEAILNAIRERDALGAEHMMALHLEAVEANMSRSSRLKIGTADV